MIYKLAFIGFGTVAQGLCEILLEKSDMLRQRYDFECQVVAVSDVKNGAVYDPKGLDISVLLDLARKGKKLDAYPSGEKGWDSIKTITQTISDVIVEVTYTDVKTGEPALTHIQTALKQGKHVVSTNKGPVIKKLRELEKLAEKHHVFYGYEGVVLSGTPLLNLAHFCLAGNTITEFKGILNGTTNYILTQMEEGMSYDDALQKAQELGYAEADPSGDVDGWDALGKVVILTNIILNHPLKWEDVERTGITSITQQDIMNAKKNNKRWKLIGQAKIENNGSVHASVKPIKLTLSDPLSGISGATNAVTFITDELGPVTIQGPGAGQRETGFALLIDLLTIHRMKKSFSTG